MQQAVGEPLPPADRHAISVSLPTWEDTQAWATRDPGFISRLKTGYPRFFVPLVVQDLATRLLNLAVSRGTLCGSDGSSDSRLTLLLYSSAQYAQQCVEYLKSKDTAISTSVSASIRYLRFDFDGNISTDLQQAVKGKDRREPYRYQEVHGVVYPESFGANAKAFWQHTGYGISSRCAEFWLDKASCIQHDKTETETGAETETGFPLEDAEKAKCDLRIRIGNLLSTPSLCIEPKHVFLHQSGMTAISSIATAIQQLHTSTEPSKVIYNFDCIFYGHGSTSELNTLEAGLADNTIKINALITEFPSNPLLTTPDLHRLRTLAQQYNFLLIVDDTLATAVNVSLLPFCDAICTSLTKMFSGHCNVMGGSVALNPASESFSALNRQLSASFEDTYFPLDALFMDHNSRDIIPRVSRASANAARIAEIFRRHHAVAEVFYPQGSATQRAYDRFRKTGGGYGFLLSVRFRVPAAASAFYDALRVAKGPSLGTNFTLCCAYTLLAHATEMEWAAGYGVVPHLVRISVGIEEVDGLVRAIGDALAATEDIRG
ncbi:pyridoxal phosphate-dependent transferase [Penicillium alfredii]|uniref:Pyridoxal phosphate-dependent transferase n=1 Tax=Penicillium alfredii TaxID=1506179 RepID=A0A9W9GAI4_9EURO|nr:pyridoxal phosphate-dependent transferase [Penicillium alfredii]KAJ5114934.1 pyridoxal phosphate-dependent transferase [Penicillium alfredii]